MRIYAKLPIEKNKETLIELMRYESNMASTVLISLETKIWKVVGTIKQ